MNSALLRLSGGKALYSAGAAVHFNGGMPMDVAGNLAAAIAVPQVYCNGLPFLNTGVLCIDGGVGTIVGYSGGMPIGANGGVATSTSLAVATNYGFPFTANGKLAIVLAP